MLWRSAANVCPPFQKAQKNKIATARAPSKYHLTLALSESESEFLIVSASRREREQRQPGRFSFGTP